MKIKHRREISVLAAVWLVISLLSTGASSQVSASASPTIQARLSAGHIVLSWPANEASFALESTTNLSPPLSWSPVFSPVFIIDGQNTVTNAASAGAKFYRLWKTDLGAILIQDERRVASSGSLRINDFLGTYTDSWNTGSATSVFAPFNDSISGMVAAWEVDASSGAWQTSRVSSLSFEASGGAQATANAYMEGGSSGAGSASASASSDFDITFQLLVPHAYNLEVLPVPPFGTSTPGRILLQDSTGAIIDTNGPLLQNGILQPGTYRLIAQAALFLSALNPESVFRRSEYTFSFRLGRPE